MVSVTKNGQVVNTFFNYKYCGSGSDDRPWAAQLNSRALKVNSEYEINVNAAESIKIQFISDYSVTRSGFSFEYTMLLNE